MDGNIRYRSIPTRSVAVADQRQAFDGAAMEP